MPVTIRLARHGRKKRPFYRIIAADSRMRRDGRYLELLGTLNPLLEPAAVTLKEDRVRYWIGVGAQTSQTCAEIIEKRIPGFLPELTQKRTDQVRAQRKKRKDRAKSGAKSGAKSAPAS